MSSNTFFADRQGRAGHRRVVGARRAFRDGTGASRRQGRRRGAAGGPTRGACARGSWRPAGRRSAVAMDVTRSAPTSSAPSQQGEAALGPISICINNAGVTDPALFVQMREEQWRSIMDVNLDGVFRVGQEAARRMIAAGNGGSIVNIASIVGLGAIKTLSAYSASKAAVIALTRNMALELARDKIRVNAIAPGYIATELNDDLLGDRRRQAHDRARADAPARHARGARWAAAAARLRCRLVHDRERADRRRRPPPADGVTMSATARVRSIPAESRSAGAVARAGGRR